MKNPSRPRLLQKLLVGLLALFWGVMVSYPHVVSQASLVDRLESTLINLRTTSFGAQSPSDAVVIVAIDDATMQTNNPLGPGRQNMADIIEQIAAAGAKVVAVDLLLADRASPQGDPALAAALAKIPAVIAVAGSIAPLNALQGLPVIANELWPLADFTENADLGIANISTDLAGVPRHVPIAFMTSRGVHPSLAARTAAFFTDTDLSLAQGNLTVGAHKFFLDDGYHMPLRVAGPAGTIPTISALDVLSGDASQALAGKAVVIGVTATGLGDRFPTPFDPDLPGVEIMATAIGQLIAGDAPRRDSLIRRIDVMAVLFLAPLCAVLALSLPLMAGVPLAMGALLVWMVLVWLAFSSGFWLSAALPVVAVLPPTLLAAFFGYQRERRAAAFSDRAVTELKKFQSPLLAEKIAADPDFLSAPQEWDLVICFVDLSGFTQLSQDMGAKNAEAFLKRFHTDLSVVAQNHNGVVLNFMGDGALLAYGITKTTQDTADQALIGAFEIAQQTKALGRESGLADPLECRVGLHHGAVLLSRLGGDRHQQLTISGDNVNLASRLLEIAKEQSATIAATAAFLAKLDIQKDKPSDFSEDFEVRGRMGSVAISFWRI